MLSDLLLLGAGLSHCVPAQLDEHLDVKREHNWNTISIRRISPARKQNQQQTDEKNTFKQWTAVCREQTIHHLKRKHDVYVWMLSS